eukprot:TRINITY_DN116805_c0_g1_i1.p1 TRINITY_DN116805_c0_g1~~TRINITY_DN116805_c0_g1_i1.p1  ORF type:complete len:214 (-),score=39.27 TRINITY_DN116805_c0_g1_i1:44-685(-)
MVSEIAVLQGDASTDGAPDFEADVGAQAQHVLEILRKCHTNRSLDPFWGNHFWVAVHDMEESLGVQPEIMEQLSSFGYKGPRTLSPPPFAELEEELSSLLPPEGTMVSSRADWEAPHPLSLQEVQAFAAGGDSLAGKALAAIERLAAEKQEAATWATLHRLALQHGRDRYQDPKTGYSVFTSAFLRKRKCCGYSCRHCPHRVGSCNAKKPPDW